MLLSAIATLECAQPGRLPPAHGRFVHGWVMDTIAAREPALAQALHTDRGDGTGQRFLVTHLRNAVTDEIVWGEIPRAAVATLRLATIDATIADALRGILSDLDSPVRIGQAEFRLRAAAFIPSQHPRAALVDPAELLVHWATTEPVPTHLELHFLTPTTFHSAGQNILFPLPALLFGGLGRRWGIAATETHAAVDGVDAPPLDWGLLTTIKEQTLVTRYDLRTDMLQYRHHRSGDGRGDEEVRGAGPLSQQKGFFGRCELEVPKDPAAARAAHLLADFAYFAGVGYKSSMGMGEIAPVRHFTPGRGPRGRGKE